MSDLRSSEQPRVPVHKLSGESKGRVALARDELEKGLARSRAFTSGGSSWRLGSVDECIINTATQQLIVPLHDWRPQSVAAITASVRHYLGDSIDFSQSGHGDGKWMVVWDLPASALSTRQRIRLLFNKLIAVVATFLLLAAAFWFFKHRG